MKLLTERSPRCLPLRPRKPSRAGAGTPPSRPGSYGPIGFIHFQCVLPLAQSYDGLVDLLSRVQERGLASFLSVLKRLGPPDGGLLSFPMHGYTLSLDLPRRDGLLPLLDDLHETVVAYGGRVYLTKDAALRLDAFRDMYPGVSEWLDVKQRIDPANRFTSAQAKRLNIIP